MESDNEGFYENDSCETGEFDDASELGSFTSETDEALPPVPQKQKYIPPQMRQQSYTGATTSTPKTSTHLGFRDDWSSYKSYSPYKSTASIREEDEARFKSGTYKVIDRSGRIYGEYVDQDTQITLESVGDNILYGLRNPLPTDHMVYFEERYALTYDHTKSAMTIISCTHKVKGKKILRGCSMCVTQNEAKGKFLLYASNMHPGQNGRDKIFRWRCVDCDNDLFASKQQILFLVGSPDQEKKIITENHGEFIHGCEFLHSWSVWRSEYVQQTVRRIFEVVTGYPSEDAVPITSMICYNAKVPFAIYMHEAFHAVVHEQNENLSRLHKEAIDFCTENGKHLMVVKPFRRNEQDKEHHIKPEVFITALFNFLLDRQLLQDKYVPEKTARYEREIQLNCGATYSKQSYLDNLRNFAFIIMKLLDSQVKNGILYSPRSSLNGNNDEFIIFPDIYYASRLSGATLAL
jgi:hypothetical protein